jgi:hypothetical protein
MTADPQFHGVGNGILSFVVWPTHAGAVKSNGEEPMFGLGYQRGQITWEMSEEGRLEGRAVIQVPEGEWAWIIYCHNAFRPGFVTTSKLAHPLVLPEPGVITLSGITEDEVKPLNPDPVLHD